MHRHKILKYIQAPFYTLCLLMIFLTGGNLIGQDLTSPLIKTGLIHKFAQHVEWQQEEVIDTFRIGVYGEEPELMYNLLLLESVDLKDKPVSISSASWMTYQESTSFILQRIKTARSRG